ncbi:MAG: PD-(D/E)XK nuclease family protein, partial [Kofleriaceae bacterium]
DPRLRVVSIPDLHRWADAVVALEVKPVFPTRLVLVPSEAHAHALRRELAARAPQALAGTRFFTAAAAARAVLDEAGIVYQLGEEVRRPLRIRALLAKQPALVAYRVEDLCTPGWEEAFASTIDQLEAAALRPDDLERLGEPRTNDLALIWRALDADAGTSWTIPRAMAEAAAMIAAEPTTWPIQAPVLAAVSIGDDAAHAALLRAIPALTLGLRSGRPARRRAVDRASALLGGAAAVAISDVQVDRTNATELGILSEFLFEAPDRLAAPDRRRSHGPDGTVSLELHAGVDEELDAAVRWIADEVFERRTPLQELAILVPTPDPLATLVADRIRALPWPTEIEPVYLADGRPATATSAGSRLLAVVLALQAFLPAESVVEILPRLRLANGDIHVTPGRARSLVNRFGTTGGSAARPEGALVWCDRARTFSASNAEDRDVATLVELANGLVPALADLVATMKVIVSRSSLGEVWAAIREFATTQLIGSSELADIVDQLDHDIVALAADPVTIPIVGIAAVELVGVRLRAQRLHAGRFGDPAIYIGTIASAAGLSFSAVRMIGLAEGSFPGTQREDAILPRELRRRLSSYAMANDEDHAAARLHALDQVVRGTTRSVALSAPRTDLDGSEREPAAVLIEAAAALGRPNAITGEAARVVPTVPDLERDAFSVARRATAVRRLATPLTEMCWLQRVAAQRDALPSEWSTPVVGDPLAVLARSSSMDGILGPDPLMVATVGTSPELPLSASALRVLLACPQRFLLERLLGFWPRREVATAGFRVDPATYGALVHRVVEQFLVAHGRAFGARDLDLPRWIEIIDAFACTAFEAFAPSYPFGGEGVVELERRRLRRDVRTFIEDDWDGGRPRAFVAVEREFGKATPVSIATSAGPLFVSGRIDRVDVERGLTIVRDLKTGRARPREGELRDPDVDLDLQLAVYAAVARGLASELDTPADVAAAYTYIDHLAPSRERAFRDDRLALVTAGNGWFDIAMSVVRDQSYVKTPDGDDCRWCPFAAVCGDHTAETADRLRDATGTLAAFRDLKA